MYVTIRQLHEKGFSKRNIAEKLNCSRNTVDKYLDMDSEAFTIWLASTAARKKKLDDYEGEILAWLRKHPDLSSAQICDWLEEKYPDFDTAESTVRRYVKRLREAYRIPKVTPKRTYEAVPESPMGFQMQVDFGQCEQRTTNGQTIKLYVAAFVLSHSRYKYMEWQDRPFTTNDLVQIHIRAFCYFGGKPREIVYDQDNIIVVSENHGDIIFTQQFEAYRRTEAFQVYACRGADPESKGKIENVIGFIKKNFSKHRIYADLEKWNEEAYDWLERRGNGKTHNTTKKRPVDVFRLEREKLRPVSNLALVAAKGKEIVPTNESITRVVRKDNVILYESNRYSVPLGTYDGQGKTVHLVVQDGRLAIIDRDTGEILGNHPLSLEKGKLIQDRSHTRDRSKGIPAYMESVAQKFEQYDLAATFLNEIRARYPRYIRDQLQLINRQWDRYPATIINSALEQCVHQKLFSGTEFEDMIQFLDQLVVETAETALTQPYVEQLTADADSSYHIRPETRPLDAYVAILEGIYEG